MPTADVNPSQPFNQSQESYTPPFPLVVRHALSRVYDE
jgi:hypothetical protein